MLDHLRKHDRSNYGLYDEILSRHVISEYISIKDEKNNKLISIAKSLEDRFINQHSEEHEKELTYYLVGYTLSGQRSLIIQDDKYESVDELVKMLHQCLRRSKKCFDEYCSQLIDSTGTLLEQFEAWLIVLGKHEELHKWRMSEYGAE